MLAAEHIKTVVRKIIIEITVFVLAKGRGAGYIYRHNDYRDKQFNEPLT
jgi:hypothetical protein